VVAYESLLENDAMYLFEHSPGVKSFREQPELIMYEYQGKMHKYYPDFEVILNSGNVLHVEVKPKTKLQQQTLLMTFKAIAQRYESHPASFLILTEDEIRKEPLHSNLKLIDQCKKIHGKRNHTVSEITTFIREHRHVTVSQIMDKFGKKLALNLLAEHQISCDIHLPLSSENNFVTLEKEADHDALFF